MEKPYIFLFTTIFLVIALSAWIHPFNIQTINDSPKYQWWTDALHGVTHVYSNVTFFDDVVPGSTSFPNVILSTASFNESLWKRIGQAVSTDICSDDHIELAQEAARQGLVLLKNENQTLPLMSHTFETLAVVGPHANVTDVMIGNYQGRQYTTPIDGFSSYGKVRYEKGCGDFRCKNDSLIRAAVRAAKKADATIILAGLSRDIEDQGRVLPGYQQEMIEQIASSSKGPVILVIMSAGGVDISFAKDSPNIQAILWAGYPAEEGGQAIADVVFGKYNPGGKLPFTWFMNNSYKDMLPPMTSMQLRPVENPDPTYKFFNGSTVLYPFGYGLSYTNFTYNLVSAKRTHMHVAFNKYKHCRDLNYTDDAYKPPCAAVLLDDMTCDVNFEFTVEVKNVGRKDGSDVVMVYAAPPKGIKRAPIKQLVAFQKVFVPAGGSKQVKFVLNTCKSLYIVDYNGYQLLPAGRHSIVIGDGVLEFPRKVTLGYLFRVSTMLGNGRCLVISFNL